MGRALHNSEVGLVAKRARVYGIVGDQQFLVQRDEVTTRLDVTVVGRIYKLLIHIVDFAKDILLPWLSALPDGRDMGSVPKVYTWLLQASAER